MGRLSRRAYPCLLALVWALACSRPEPPPPRPAATPSIPTPNPAAPQDDADLEVADAFDAEARQVADQANLLATAPCDRLVAATEQDPALVSTLRGYGATLRALAASQEALARLSTQRLVREMEEALARMDETLRSCRLDPRPREAHAPHTAFNVRRST